MPLVSVIKCQGTGNDFVLLDARSQPDARYSEIAKTLCERRLAIGADGLLVLREPQSASADAALRIFNADGSEAAMCGNGIRCVARYLYDADPEKTELRIDTLAGVMETRVVSWNGKTGVRVAMGVPEFVGADNGKLDRTIVLDGEAAPTYALWMGNPNVVAFVTGNPERLELKDAADAIVGWKVFPEEPNVEIASVGANAIQVRVRERGVGETWACGTGACAVAAAAIASGRASSPVLVRTRGGAVQVSWSGQGQSAFLTGDAELVFRTEVELGI